MLSFTYMTQQHVKIHEAGLGKLIKAKGEVRQV
jgi:hypothetical protein